MMDSSDLKIKVISDGKNLVQINSHYGSKEITEIFKEMIDYELD